MKLRLVLLLSVLLSTACVDQGNKLERLRFTTTADVTQPLSAPVTAFQCFPQTVTLIGEFTDGSLGNFTQRGARYTSSDTSKLQVSNGDIPLPNPADGFYARGILIPGNTTGTPGADTPVILTATFAGLSATAQVIVHAAGTITVEPVSAVSPALGPYLAPDSFLGLRATTRFDGQPVNVTGFGEWSFNPADDAVATISKFTGAINAKSPGALTAQFTLASCATGPQTISLPVKVEALTGIEVSRQFPGRPVLVSATPILFTTDAITTTGRFAGGQRQDLTFQSVLSLPEGTQSLQIRSSNLLTAVREFDETVTPPVSLVPAAVTATFKSPNTDAGTLFTAVTEAISAKAANLQTVEIPANERNPVIAGFDSYQFHVTGNFLDATNGSLLTQDITRHAGWVSSNTQIAVIGNTYGSVSAANGLATSLKNEAGGCVTITADTGLLDSSATPTIISTNTLLAISPTAQPCTPIAPP